MASPLTSTPDPVAAIDSRLAELDVERARLQVPHKVLVGESAFEPAGGGASDPVKPVGRHRRGLRLPYLASGVKRALEVAVAIGIIALIQAGVAFYNGRVSDSIARHGQQLTAHGLELTAEGLLLTAHGQQLTACESPTARGQLTRDNLAKCRAALNHTVGELPAPTPDRVGGHAARNVVVPTTLKRIT